jgi:hypothetical protein
MKSWIITFIVLGVVLYMFFPLVNRQRQCYINSDADLSQIASNLENLRISRDASCSQTTESLFTLENCLSDATKSSMIASYTNGTIRGVVALIRPFGSDLWMLKADHNKECDSSSKYQLP